MTNQQLIDRAFIEDGIIEAGDAANSTDSADALDTLNEMMAVWAVSDRDIGWFTQDTLGDTAPMPLWAEQGIISSFGLELTIPFRVALPPQVRTDMESRKETVTRTLMNLALEPTDMTDLPQGRENFRNILTD